MRAQRRVWQRHMDAAEAAVRRGDTRAAADALFRFLHAPPKQMADSLDWWMAFRRCAQELAALFEAQGDDRMAASALAWLGSAEEDMLLTLIPVKERSVGPDHPDVAGLLHLLAVAYDRQGKQAAAHSPLTTHHSPLTTCGTSAKGGGRSTGEAGANPPAVGLQQGVSAAACRTRNRQPAAWNGV
jgi:hypothetical protein